MLNGHRSLICSGSAESLVRCGGPTLAWPTRARFMVTRPGSQSAACGVSRGE
ncbi:hypothetical protein DAD186_07030 [Dermabacter vaginalis]|uniref:Uncharacterized protein n=1 Tax=Dermabacter vaginalis TaxID=1630135 RepID=A0A1B0ZH66_9MICO|nr:hypothetical protein DAD186_07030 [Dermabacter vaginalis]